MRTIAYVICLDIGAFSLRHCPLRYGLGITAVLASAMIFTSWTGVIERVCSFYGVHTVTVTKDGKHHLLIHGTTVHGAQLRDPLRRREPLTYFHRHSPIGQLFAARPNNQIVGVVGLGAGTLACYRRPGEDWTFFEIEPSVVELVRDQRYFTYLADCAPDARIMLGDGRLSLTREPDGRFDLLILDACSSVPLPVHLVTREAFVLYAQKLRPGGIIVAQMTNRYLDLGPVIVNAAARARPGRPDPELSAHGDQRGCSTQGRAKKRRRLRHPGPSPRGPRLPRQQPTLAPSETGPGLAPLDRRLRRPRRCAPLVASGQARPPAISIPLEGNVVRWRPRSSKPVRGARRAWWVRPPLLSAKPSPPGDERRAGEIWDPVGSRRRRGGRGLTARDVPRAVVDQNLVSSTTPPQTPAPRVTVALSWCRHAGARVRKRAAIGASGP